MNKRKYFTIIFIFLLALISIVQVHNLLLFPYNRGFDNQDHIYYIDYLKKYQRFPLANEGWELWQAPLYYLIGSLIGSLAGLRIIHFIAWIILVVLFFYLLRKLIKNYFIVYIATLVLASLPVIFYSIPNISNEFFSAVAISCAMIYYCLNQKLETGRQKLILGTLLGLALLAKATAFILIVSLIIDQLFICKGKLVRFLRQLLPVLFIVLVISGWFYIRNTVVFKNPFIASIDFPQMAPKQKLNPRDLSFFINLKGFIKFDLFKAHHYSLIPGTYFSWFYDGHNNVVPVQEYSKAGILLIIFSLPVFFIYLKGYFIGLKKITDRNRFLLLYPLLLITSYILYNIKIPDYSTVKGAFLISSIVPFGYFFAVGLKDWERFKTIITIYVFLYVMLIIKNFWIIKGWYK